MRINILLLFLVFTVPLFSQEKVRIKGFYEESYNRLEVEDSYKDTTIYRKLGFKEAWKKKKVWTPWSKVEVKRNKINNYDQLSHRYMLNVSYDDIIADSVWCTNQAVVTTAFPLDIQVLLDKMGEKFTFDGIRKKAKFYTKEHTDFYLYRLYQFDGFALKYSYTWDEIKTSKRFENEQSKILSNICDENEPIDVYYFYKAVNFEPIDVPTDYVIPKTKKRK